MADNELQIILKAVDEVSGTVKNIENQLKKSQESMQNSSEKTSKTFDEQANNLLALGNAARSAEGIMSSYNMMQLRLENSGERLQNAQDRLSDAQRNLNNLVASGTASSEDMYKARTELERASRGLTIAENNLKKTEDLVLGTYISIGIQTVSLIQSMPKLINSVKALTAASIQFMLTPIGIAIAALGAAALIIAGQINKTKKEVADLTKALDEQVSIINTIKDNSTGVYETLLTDSKLYYDTLMKINDLKTLDTESRDIEIARRKLELSENQLKISNLEIQARNVGLSNFAKLADEELKRKEDVLKLEKEITKLESEKKKTDSDKENIKEKKEELELLKKKSVIPKGQESAVSGFMTDYETLKKQQESIEETLDNARLQNQIETDKKGILKEQNELYLYQQDKSGLVLKNTNELETKNEEIKNTYQLTLEKMPLVLAEVQKINPEYATGLALRDNIVLSYDSEKTKIDETIAKAQTLTAEYEKAVTKKGILEGKPGLITLPSDISAEIKKNQLSGTSTNSNVNNTNGLVVNIGTVNGLNATNVADALQKKLGTMIR